MLRTDSIYQVNIDIGGPLATRRAQVDLDGFFRAPTWWSLSGQKKLSNVPLTPERVSVTPPLAQPAAPLKGRLRKPSAKVIEAR